MPGTRAGPPRHIRDIAHLYLSRMRAPSRELRLVVAGVTRDSIPGFHTANLALAAAARGFRVHVADMSGLPANTGCFLALAPRSWAGAPDAETGDVTAFPGVTFSLRRERAEEAVANDDDDSRDVVDVVHAPPWETGAGHLRVVRDAFRQGSTILVYLALHDGESAPWRRPDADLPGVPRRVLFVTRAGRAVTGEEVAGTVTHWTRAITDPLPVIVRDPRARLARQYGEALSTLLRDTPLARPALSVAPG